MDPFSLLLVFSKYWKLIAGAIVVLTGIGVGCMIEKHGADRAMEKVNVQNQKSSAGALEGARNVDDCYRAGGVWSTRTGECGGG